MVKAKEFNDVEFDDEFNNSSYSLFDILQDDKIQRFDTICRFNHRDAQRKETNSGHSWWVVFFTAILCDSMFDYKHANYLTVFNECLLFAQFHDYDEVITGDVSHELKYNSFNGNEIRQAIDKYKDNYLNENYYSSNGGIKNFIYVCLKLQTSVITKKIVKIADWLALIKNLEQEKRLGNTNLEGTVRSNATNSLYNCIIDFISLWNASADDSNNDFTIINNVDELLKLKLKLPIKTTL